MFSISFVRLVVGFKTSPVVAPIHLHCIMKIFATHCPFRIRLYYVAWPTTLAPSRLSFSHMSVIPQRIPKRTRRLMTLQEYAWRAKNAQNLPCVPPLPNDDDHFRPLRLDQSLRRVPISLEWCTQNSWTVIQKIDFYDGFVTRMWVKN